MQTKRFPPPPLMSSTVNGVRQSEPPRQRAEAVVNGKRIREPAPIAARSVVNGSESVLPSATGQVQR